MSICVYDDWKDHVEVVFSYSIAHNILACLHEVVQKANLSFEQIDEYWVTTGPGGFTSVRLAMLCMRTLAFVHNKALYCLPTHTLLVLLASQQMCFGQKVVVVQTSSKRFCCLGIYEYKETMPILTASAQIEWKDVPYDKEGLYIFTEQPSPETIEKIGSYVVVFQLDWQKAFCSFTKEQLCAFQVPPTPFYFSSQVCN